jgi:hypothetical protein
MQLILKRQSYTLSSGLENLRTRNERTFAYDMLICNLRLFSSGTDREAPSFVYKHKELFVWFFQWQVNICNVGKYVAETLIILSVNAESSCMNTEKGTPVYWNSPIQLRFCSMAMEPSLTSGQNIRHSAVSM